MRVLERDYLDPVDGRASFYHKAVYIETDAGAFLRSYNTVVAAVIGGAPVRLWDGYSQTTLRHINAFFYKYGVETVSKKEWLQMPVETLDGAAFLGFMCA